MNEQSMDIIFETTDYSKFECYRENRDAKKIFGLVESMKKHGFISGYPLHVVEKDGKLQIKGGHHRFAAAKHLGIPVKYSISNDTASVHELEKSGPGKWTTTDYLESFVRQGKPDYVTLKNYMLSTGISLTLCIGILSTIGSAENGSNLTEKFKSGDFVVTKDMTKPKKIMSIVYSMKKMGIGFANSSHFVVAISKMLFLKEFDAEYFLRKVMKHKSRLEKQHSIDKNLEMIETIYNIGEKKKNPLSFLAKDASKLRATSGLPKKSKK